MNNLPKLDRPKLTDFLDQDLHPTKEILNHPKLAAKAFLLNVKKGNFNPLFKSLFLEKLVSFYHRPEMPKPLIPHSLMLRCICASPEWIKEETQTFQEIVQRIDQYIIDEAKETDFNFWKKAAKISDYLRSYPEIFNYLSKVELQGTDDTGNVIVEQKLDDCPRLFLATSSEFAKVVLYGRRAESYSESYENLKQASEKVLIKAKDLNEEFINIIYDFCKTKALPDSYNSFQPLLNLLEVALYLKIDDLVAICITRLEKIVDNFNTEDWEISKKDAVYYYNIFDSLSEKLSNIFLQKIKCEGISQISRYGEGKIHLSLNEFALIPDQIEFFSKRAHSISFTSRNALINFLVLMESNNDNWSEVKRLDLCSVFKSPPTLDSFYTTNLTSSLEALFDTDQPWEMPSTEDPFYQEMLLDSNLSSESMLFQEHPPMYSESDFFIPKVDSLSPETFFEEDQNSLEKLFSYLPQVETLVCDSSQFNRILEVANLKELKNVNVYKEIHSISSISEARFTLLEKELNKLLEKELNKELFSKFNHMIFTFFKDDKVIDQLFSKSIEISFKNNYFTDPDDSLMQELSFCENLNLHFSNMNNVTPAGFRHYLHNVVYTSYTNITMKKCPGVDDSVLNEKHFSDLKNLESLELRKLDNLSDAGLISFFKAISSSQNQILKSIRLCDNPRLTKKSLIPLGSMNLPNLEELVLTRFPKLSDSTLIPIISGKKLWKVFIPNNPLLTDAVLKQLEFSADKLIRLDLSGCKFSKEALVSLFSKCKNLDYVKLNNCNVDDDVIRALIDCNKDIYHVEIANCSQVTGKSLEKLLEVDSEGPLTYNLQNCTGITKEDLLNWLKANSKLENIDTYLSSLNIGGIADNRILDFLKESYYPTRRLYLQGSKGIDPNKLKEILKNRHLFVLDIRDCDFENKDIDELKKLRPTMDLIYSTKRAIEPERDNEDVSSEDTSLVPQIKRPRLTDHKGKEKVKEGET